MAYGTESTNGVGLHPEGKRLYVAETHTGRVWGWDVVGPGQLGYDPSSDTSHGGACSTTCPGAPVRLGENGDGSESAATLGQGGITCVAPDGSRSEHLSLPDPLVTNICFGGDDGRTAFITSSGRGELLRSWSRPGLSLVVRLVMERTLFTDEHELFRDSFRRWLDKEIVPAPRGVGRGRDRAAELFAEAGAHGFLGIERARGARRRRRRRLPLQRWSSARRSRRPGSAAPGLGITLHNDICLPYFLRYCTDEQRERWLPGIASGELITAIAMTEPGIGSDLASMSTTAIRDGDHYVVNGSKTFITNGINADLVITAVKTDPSQRHKGMSLRRPRAGHGRLRAGPQPREDRPARPGHRRAVLHRRAGAGGEPARRGGPGLRAARRQPPPGAAVDRRRRRGRGPRPRSAGRSST